MSGGERRCLAHSPLWDMLQLGAPRPRARVPLGSTHQVGLARTEVPPSWSFQRSGGHQRISDPSLGLTPIFQCLQEARKGQGWPEHGRVSKWGMSGDMKAFSWWASRPLQ